MCSSFSAGLSHVIKYLKINIPFTAPSEKRCFCRFSLHACHMAKSYFYSHSSTNSALYDAIKIFYIIFYIKMKNNPEHHELCEMAEYERDEREHFALCFHINICILAQVPLFCLSIHLFCATHTHRKCISLVKHSRRNGVREDSWSVIYVQTIAKCCY